MEELLQILMQDETLLNLTNNKIKAFGDLGIEKGLTYSFSPISNNGVKATYRFTFTAVSFSITDSQNIIKRINKLLLTIGDNRLTHKILKVIQSGGGNLTNIVDGRKMYHFQSIYIITRRED